MCDARIGLYFTTKFGNDLSESVSTFKAAQ